MTFKYTTYQRNQFLSLNKLEKYCKPDTSYVYWSIFNTSDWLQNQYGTGEDLYHHFREKTSPTFLNTNNVVSKILISRQLNKVVFFDKIQNYHNVMDVSFKKLLNLK